MDIDNLMSDPAQPFTASQDQATESSSSNSALWDVKVYKEEVANIKPRLLDQKFNASKCSRHACLGSGSVNRLLINLIDDYMDPFKPHPAAAQRGDEDVQRWQAVIDRMTEKA
jgi:hypothetical protein